VESLTNIAIDLDGVITANPDFFRWLTYHLSKNENRFKIFVITWRDGSNPERVEQTKKDLELFGIRYDSLIMAPKKFGGLKQAAYWKIATINENKINLWLDDEIKSYKRDLNINLDFYLPKVLKIWI
jgi:hypothetical protein